MYISLSLCMYARAYVRVYVCMHACIHIRIDTPYVLNRCSRISGRSHKNTNAIFHLVNPIYNMDMYTFKGTVLIKRAKYE